jgi:hypothetical protein
VQDKDPERLIPRADALHIGGARGIAAISRFCWSMVVGPVGELHDLAIRRQIASS